MIGEVLLEIESFIIIKAMPLSVFIILQMRVISQVTIFFVILTQLLITSQLISQDKEISIILKKMPLRVGEQNDYFFRILSDKQSQQTQITQQVNTNTTNSKSGYSFLQGLLLQIKQNKTQSAQHSNSGEKPPHNQNSTFQTNQIINQSQEKENNTLRNNSTQQIAQNNLLQNRTKQIGTNQAETKDSNPIQQQPDTQNKANNESINLNDEGNDVNNASVASDNSISIAKPEKNLSDWENLKKESENQTENAAGSQQVNNSTVVPAIDNSNSNQQQSLNNTQTNSTNFAKQQSQTIPQNLPKPKPEVQPSSNPPPQVPHQNPITSKASNNNKGLIAVIIIQSLIIVVLTVVIVCGICRKKYQIHNRKMSYQIQEEPIPTDCRLTKVNN